MKTLRWAILALLSSQLLLGAPVLWQRNARPLQAETDVSALEPWETPVSAFFIRNHHEVPIVDRDTWEVQIDGLVDKPLRLSLKDLRRFPTRTLHAVLECSGNGRSLQSPKLPGVQWEKGAVGNAEWTGVSLADVLAAAGVKPEAKFIRLEGADKPALPTVPEFVRSIPLAKALEKDTLLAWNMNRESLPQLHGGPLRVVLPRWYGQNWIKWIRHITVMDQEDGGFYMKNGYRMPKTPLKPGAAWDASTGTPIQELRVQSLIVTPRSGMVVPTGEVELSGKAFSGTGTIAKVEISVDNGKNWILATVEPAHASGGWQIFHHRLSFPDAASVTVISRATDTAGNVQPMEMDWNPGGYLRNDVDRVTFDLRDKRWFETSALVTEKCLICHSAQIVKGQNLTSAGWEKVIKKMEKFGAILTEEERGRLVLFLAEGSASAAAPPPSSSAVDFGAQSARFRPEREKGATLAKGKVLYGAQCAACHGANGEGKTGPRLMGRAIPREDFLAMVKEGRGTMPSFGQTLKLADISSIRGYLARPAK